jgi:DNA-binding NarL/FixJ family response regulator
MSTEPTRPQHVLQSAGIAASLIVADALLARRIAAVAAASPTLTLRSPSEASVLVLGDEETTAKMAERIQALRLERPAVRIVVVTKTGSAGRCRRLLDAGADGVVLAAAVENGIASAVTAVAAGHLVQPRSLLRVNGQSALSNREKQVLGLVVLGFSNRGIGRQLFLAESTVKSHMQSIFLKLDVRSRTEAVAAVLDPERGLGLGVLALTESGTGPPTRSTDES